MSLAILTSPEAVEAAIEEADRLGPERFLAKYNFGTGSMYLKYRDGSEYDAEAILAAAVGKQYPDRGPLKPSEFRATPEEIREKLPVDPVTENESLTAGLRDPESKTPRRISMAVKNETLTLCRRFSFCDGVFRQFGHLSPDLSQFVTAPNGGQCR